jgi:glycosyltransferase involved in cell wall biosynthesis
MNGVRVARSSPDFAGPGESGGTSSSLTLKSDAPTSPSGDHGTAGAVRVAHLTSVHQVDDERIFVKECRSLAAAGFEVALVGPSDGDRQRDGVRIIGVPQPRGRLGRMIGTSWHVLRGSVASRAEICHFHDPELIPVGFLLKLLGRRVIYDVHEDCPRDILGKGWIRPILKQPLAAGVGLIEAIAGRLLDGIVAVTPTIAARFPPSKTITLSNFPMLEEFPAAVGTPQSQRPRQVCYVGTLSEARGLFDMIDAAGRVGGAAPSLLLAGAFDSTDEEARSRAEPGWARVDYLGWLDRAAIARFMASSRAGLVVLHPTPCFVDAYPIKMFEYMAASLPVIASDFPVYREILGDGACGLLVPPADPPALARAIEWIFDHPDEAQAMGERGRRRVERLYTWQVEREKLFSFYRRLARTPSYAPADP